MCGYYYLPPAIAAFRCTAHNILEIGHTDGDACGLHRVMSMLYLGSARPMNCLSPSASCGIEDMNEYKKNELPKQLRSLQGLIS